MNLPLVQCKAIPESDRNWSGLFSKWFDEPSASSGIIKPGFPVTQYLLCSLQNFPDLPLQLFEKLHIVKQQLLHGIPALPQLCVTIAEP